MKKYYFLIFIFFGLLLFKTMPVKAANDIFLYQDKTKKVVLKSIYNIKGIRCYNVIINGKKSKIIQSPGDNADLCVFGSSVKFYKTDSSDWVVFYSHSKDDSNGQDDAAWEYINIKTGKVFVVQEHKIFKSEFDGKLEHEGFLQHTGLCKNNTVAFGVSDLEKYNLSIEDVPQGNESLGNGYQGVAFDKVKNSTIKFNGFLVNVGTISGNSLSYNASTTSYLAVPKENLIIKTKDFNYIKPDKSIMTHIVSEICNTEKLVTGFNKDFSKMYFTAGSDYLVSNKIKSWKNSYALNLKNKLITKENPKNVLRMKYVKSF